jgi:hypothetical protein
MNNPSLKERLLLIGQARRVVPSAAPGAVEDFEAEKASAAQL